MRTFITADTHVGHRNIIKFCPESRGQFEDAHEMSLALLESINETVSSKDRLIILGDIVMGNFEDSINLLAQVHAAEIVLIPGNHDRWSLAYHHKAKTGLEGIRGAWQEKYEEPFGGRAITYRDTRPSAWESLFTLTGDEKYLGSALDDVRYSHYPYVGDSHGDGEDRYGHLRPVGDDIPLIHGHVHQEWLERGNMLNVGVDAPGRGFVPWSEEELEAWVLNL